MVWVWVKLHVEWNYTHVYHITRLKQVRIWVRFRLSTKSWCCDVVVWERRKNLNLRMRKTCLKYSVCNDTPNGCLNWTIKKSLSSWKSSSSSSIELSRWNRIWFLRDLKTENRTLWKGKINFHFHWFLLFPIEQTFKDFHQFFLSKLVNEWKYWFYC